VKGTRPGRFRSSIFHSHPHSHSHLPAKRAQKDTGRRTRRAAGRGNVTGWTGAGAGPARGRSRTVGGVIVRMRSHHPVAGYSFAAVHQGMTGEWKCTSRANRAGGKSPDRVLPRRYPCDSSENSPGGRSQSESRARVAQPVAGSGEAASTAFGACPGKIYSPGAYFFPTRGSSELSGLCEEFRLTVRVETATSGVYELIPAVRSFRLARSNRHRPARPPLRPPVAAP
jgi:hypothetical protein